MVHHDCVDDCYDYDSHHCNYYVHGYDYYSDCHDGGDYHSHGNHYSHVDGDDDHDVHAGQMHMKSART